MMAVYLIAVLISIIFGYFAQKAREKKGIRYYGLLCLSALPLFLVAACRYQIGTDYNVYITLHIPDVLKGNYRNIEFLYRYVIQLGAWLTPKSYQGVFILTHLIIILMIFAGISASSQCIVSSILILFLTGTYNFSLNIMRQCIGVSIFLFAIRYILERKPVHYVLCILLAGLFHKTSLIYLVLYLINLKDYIPVKRKYLYGISYGVIGICYLWNKQIRLMLVSIADKVGYGHYFNQNFDFGTTQMDFLLINLALLFLITIYIGLQSQKESDADHQHEMDILFYMQIVTTIICVLSSVIPNSTRVIYMFMSSQIILYPMVMKSSLNLLENAVNQRSISLIVNSTLEEKVMLGITILSILIYIVLFIRMILIRHIGDTLPYRSIINK